MFNLQVPAACSGMPGELLSPIDNWEDKETYRHQLRHLAGLFADNFQKLKVSKQQSKGKALRTNC